eukprot:gene12431-12567_t
MAVVPRYAMTAAQAYSGRCCKVARPSLVGGVPNIRGAKLPVRAYTPSIQPQSQPAKAVPSSVFEGFSGLLDSLLDKWEHRPDNQGDEDEIPAELREFLESMSQEDAHGCARHSHIADRLASESSHSTFDV